MAMNIEYNEKKSVWKRERERVCKIKGRHLILRVSVKEVSE
jgi:hypothetical protein